MRRGKNGGKESKRAGATERRLARERLSASKSVGRDSKSVGRDSSDTRARKRKSTNSKKHRKARSATKSKLDDPYRFLGHTNGGPSAKYALTIGSHGTKAVDSNMIPSAKLDLAGTAPYWAADIPSDMPQKQLELKGEDKLMVVPPELRKSFRKRMEDLVSGKAAERKHDAGPLRELADGLKDITSKDHDGDAEGAQHQVSQVSDGAAWKGDGEVAPSSVKNVNAKQVLTRAAHDADTDPLNANDRINSYMNSQVTQKESSFKDFEKTLHYDPNAF